MGPLVYKNNPTTPRTPKDVLHVPSHMYPCTLRDVPYAPRKKTLQNQQKTLQCQN